MLSQGIEPSVQVKLGSFAARLVDDGVLPIVFVPVGEDWADRMREIEHLAGQVDDEFGDQRTNSNWVSLSPRGPTMQLEGAESVEDLRQWVDRFAVLLGRAGFAGVIRVARPAWGIQSPANAPRSALCAFVGYSCTGREWEYVGDGTQRYWAVAPDVTDELINSAVAWATIPDGRVFLTQAVFSMEIAAGEGGGRHAIGPPT